MNRTRAYWLCQIAGWSLFWAVDVFIRPENWAPGEIQTTLLTWAFRVVVGIAATHAFRTYVKQHRWARLPLSRLIPRGLAASIILGGLTTALKAGPVALGLLRRSAHTRADPPLAWGAIGDMLLAGCWIAIYFGVHSAWNYRQAEIDRWKLMAEAESARLEALKLQLNPHFFFNSLTSIRALIPDAPSRARRMIGRLAHLLRRTLQSESEKTVPLREEIQASETYLKLEKIRLEDRLDWDIDLSDSTLDHPVPHMLVQTLAENAVRHGVSKQQGGGSVIIEGEVVEEGATEGTDRAEENMLRLEVKSPGRLDKRKAKRGEGTSLQNARERLHLLFGEDASLHLRQHDSETVAATATLPSRTRIGAADGHVENRGENARGALPERSAIAYATDGISTQTGSAPNTDANQAPDLTKETEVPTEATEGCQSPPQGSAATGTPSQTSEERDQARIAKHLLSGSTTYWGCQIVAWGGLVFFTTLAATDLSGQSWSTIVGELALSFGQYGSVGIGLTHGFRAYAKRTGWPDLSPLQLAPRIVGSAVLLGTGYVLLTLPWALKPDLPSAWGPWLIAALEWLAPPAFAFSVFMGIWLSVYFGVQAARNYRQAEVDRWKLQARAETARLEALRLQLNPHFFFNSLASVRALISEAPGRAKKMIARLARLLRKALRAGDEKTVELRREISTTRTYLQLEQVRFEDRFDWRIDASEEALGRQVPFMLLQTLAENAVKHGIGQRREGGTVVIDADIVGGGGEDMLRLQVTNPGRLGGGAGAEQGSGTGLDNARQRLRLLFGDEASLELRQSGPETVTATAWIPRPSAIEDRIARSGATQSSAALRPPAASPEVAKR